MTEGDGWGPGEGGTRSSEGSERPARLRVIRGEGTEYGPPRGDVEVAELEPGVWSIG